MDKVVHPLLRPDLLGLLDALCLWNGPPDAWLHGLVISLLQFGLLELVEAGSLMDMADPSPVGFGTVEVGGLISLGVSRPTGKNNRSLF